MAEQGAFLFPTVTDTVSDEVIGKCRNMKAALRMCYEVSGYPLKDVAFQINIDEKYLTRMFADNPEDNRHFPPDKINDLMKICGNLIPLRWLALSRGYGLFRLKSEVEIENERLKEELHKEQEKLATIQEFLKSVKGV